MGVPQLSEGEALRRSDLELLATDLADDPCRQPVMPCTFENVIGAAGRDLDEVSALILAKPDRVCR